MTTIPNNDNIQSSNMESLLKKFGGINLTSNAPIA